MEVDSAYSEYCPSGQQAESKNVAYARRQLVIFMCLIPEKENSLIQMLKLAPRGWRVDNDFLAN